MITPVTKEEALFTDNQWDTYVGTADNGTLFHKKRFLNYHPEDRFNNVSLLFRKREKIIALSTFAIIEKDGKRVFSSYPGASWGGFVSEQPLTYQQANEICNLTVEYAKQSQCDALEITLPPAIYQNVPNDTMTFCLLKSGMNYKKRELCSIIDLRKGELLIDRSVRKAVSKSRENNVKIHRGSSDLPGFYALLEKNLAAKESKPTHTLNELMLLKESFPLQIELWSAFKDGEYIGGLCNWEVREKMWLVFYSCYDTEYAEYRVLNRLFYNSSKYYLSKGAEFVDFGTSSIDMKVNEGLINFKELYSAYGVFRDTLQMDI